MLDTAQTHSRQMFVSQGRSQTPNLGGAFLFFGKNKITEVDFLQFMETDRLFPRSSWRVYYSSGQSHFSEISVKMTENNKFVTRFIQRRLKVCEKSVKTEHFRLFLTKKVHQWGRKVPPVTQCSEKNCASLSSGFSFSSSIETCKNSAECFSILT